MLHCGAPAVLYLCGCCCIGPAGCCICGVTVLQCMPIHVAVGTSCAISSVSSLLHGGGHTAVDVGTVSCTPVDAGTMSCAPKRLLPNARIVVHGLCLLFKGQVLKHVTVKVAVWDLACCLRLILPVTRADDNTV